MKTHLRVSFRQKAIEQITDTKEIKSNKYDKITNSGYFNE